MRNLTICTAIASLFGGCVGAMGGYGPGMTNEQRVNTGCVRNGLGSYTVTCTTRGYDSGGLEYGIQLGARMGAVAATAGSIKSGTGMAVDAHTDIVVAAARWGVGVSTGYTNDQLFGVNDGGHLVYSGFPVVAYGQVGLTRKIFAHAGGGRVFRGSVKRVEPDETSADASAWRGIAGLTFVFKRNSRSDLALRFELRSQRSSAATIDDQDATWSSTGLLAEIIWATF